MKTTPEQRAYSRGYAAGRRRSGYEFDRTLARAEREDFRQRAALIALDAMMRSGTWGIRKDGTHKPYSSMEEYARAAFQFADELVQRTSFSGMLFKASATEAGTAETTEIGSAEGEGAVAKPDAQGEPQ